MSTSRITNYARRITHHVSRFPRITHFALALLLSTSIAFGATEEHIPTGIRPLGMGEAFTAIADDATGVRRNPAGLARLGRYTFELEQTPFQLFGELKTDYLSAAIPVSEKSAFGIDWVQVGIDDEELNAKQNHVNVAYSYQPFNSMSFGVNLKYLTGSTSLDTRPSGAAVGWGTDMGVIFQPNRHWTVGVLAQDFIGFGGGIKRGTWLRHDTGTREKVFSTIYKLGVAYRPTRRWCVSAELTDRFHLGAEFQPTSRFTIRGGLQKDLSVGESPTYSLGGSIKYRWLNLNVAYLLPPTLPPTGYVGLSLNFDYRKLPVKIEQLRLRDLYPVHYLYYATPNREAKATLLDDSVTPPAYTAADRERYYPLSPSDTIGRIWLKNESDKRQTVRLELFIEGFVSGDGTEVALKDIELPPRKRVSVPMQRLVLSRDALDLNHTQPVEARLKVVESGGAAYRIATTTVQLHGIHTTLLDDVAKLTSFISPVDEAVKAFKDRVRGTFQAEIRQTDLPQNLYFAMLIFNALHGIAYDTDANIPFESGTIDEIRYPHEMLGRLMKQLSGGDNTYAFGDCDDSTALYCSLLESAGIKTALIQLPGHVLMAFDLGGISIEHAQEIGLSNNYYVSINGQVWIPIETTLIKDGFTAAWKKALEEIQSGAVQESITVEEGWNRYGPAYPRGLEQQFEIQKAEIQQRLVVDLTDPWLEEFRRAFTQETNTILR